MCVIDINDAIKISKFTAHTKKTDATKHRSFLISIIKQLAEAVRC